MLPNLLHTAFDDLFCDQIRAELAKANVRIHTNARAVSIEGGDAVSSVILENGETIPADMVLVGVGGKPNIDLAKNAGLRITQGGSIWVDAYMRTPDKRIFCRGRLRPEARFLHPQRDSGLAGLHGHGRSPHRRHQSLSNQGAAPDPGHHCRVFNQNRWVVHRQCRPDTPGLRSRRVSLCGGHGRGAGPPSRRPARSGQADRQTDFRRSRGHPSGRPGFRGDCPQAN